MSVARTQAAAVTGGSLLIERRLAARILDAALRENYGSVRRYVGTGGGDGGSNGGDGRGSAGALVLRVPGHRPVRLLDHGAARRGDNPGDGDGGRAGDLTGRHPGFLSERVVEASATLDEVLAIMRTVADPRDDLAGFEQEARHALLTAHLHEEIGPRVLRRLRARGHRAATAGRLGPGSTYYDTLAAFNDHPVHPAGRSRLGMSRADLLAYAPECAPHFRLRWAAVPAELVTARGRRPGWWPEPEQVGLDPRLAATHDLFPVHPLTARGLRAGGSPRSALIEGSAAGLTMAPEPYLEVSPTLSVRTVCAVSAGGEHLKLPLPISTLGLRNRRTITPGSLADGALVQRLLERIARTERRPVLLADEQTYAHAGDPMLGFLVRRFGAETRQAAAVVPVAALLARAPEGGYVIEGFGVGTGTLFDTYLKALFSWNVLLFVRYGIALEAHQQNVALVLDRPVDEQAGGPAAGREAGRLRLRLLLKDNDAALIDPVAAAVALGESGESTAGGESGAPLWPIEAQVEDERLLSADPEARARVFVTITLHLCAAALAFGLAERRLLPLDEGLGLVRDRLDEALGRYGNGAAFLRSRTLDADRLPTKAMITAGTLVGKDRTGARDINKHYGPSGPNYLREVRCS